MTAAAHEGPAVDRSRWVRDRAAAVALPDLLPAISGVLRADSWRTRRAVWAALVDFMADDGTITVGYGHLAERASVHAGRRVGRSTAAQHVRDLTATGVILVVQPGATTEAPGAPTYALLGPRAGAMS